MIRPGILTVAVLVVVAGCGGGGTTPSDAGGPAGPAKAASGGSPEVAASAPTAAPQSAVIKVPREKLSIGDYMPPLDDDRIEIPKPQGWQALPRDSDYLTRFYQTNRNGLPRIEITVEPRTYGSLETATAANVEEFARLVAGELDDLELVENVIPLVIGETACARYVGRVDLKLSAGQTISAERQRLLVLHAGRQYTIDLLVLPNTLRQSRDAAYAVCAGLRFPGGGQTATAAQEIGTLGEAADE